jgi:hypothetical protein
MPLVSWKYSLVEAGHWWVFFMGLYCWPDMWPRLLRLFIWSMLGLVAYTLGHHAFYGFRTDQALLAPMPFFADHTVYSAVLVLVLLCQNPPKPSLTKMVHHFSNFKLKNLLSTGSTLFKSNLKFEKKNLKRITALGGFASIGVCLLALYLAGSRAAWLSLLLSCLFGLMLYFQKYWRWWVLLGGIAFFAGIFFQEKLTARFAADVSAQERLNRYSCAWRMAADRPGAGFGPGTFQFQYLPYQKKDALTRISISEPITERGPANYGRGGGAHSEYLQALAELGWPGCLLWLLLVLFSLRQGIRSYWQTREVKWLLLSLALFSFFLHALVNNFLHDARMAALVWGIVALLAGRERVRKM